MVLTFLDFFTVFFGSTFFDNITRTADIIITAAILHRQCIRPNVTSTRLEVVPIRGVIAWAEIQYEDMPSIVQDNYAVPISDSDK